MHWIYLIIASTLEIAWIMSLKYSDGFTRIMKLCGVVGLRLTNST